MMSLKPYISLQQKYLSPDKGMEIYYLGVCISVPNGYQIYQRKPQKKSKKGKVAQVRFLLFAATSQINAHPNDYLYYFNKSDWSNLESIEVEVLYLEAGDISGGSYPIYDPFDYDQDQNYSEKNLKRVGFSRVDLGDASDDSDSVGLLYQEEGLGQEAHIPNMGYPDFPIIDKLSRKHIARAVGGGTSGGSKPPPGGGGDGG